MSNTVNSSGGPNYYSSASLYYGPKKAFTSNQGDDRLAFDSRANSFYAGRFPTFAQNVDDSFSFTEFFATSALVAASGINFEPSGNTSAQFLSDAGSEYCKIPIKLKINWFGSTNSPGDDVVFGARTRPYSTSVPTGFIETGASVDTANFILKTSETIAQNQITTSVMYIDGAALNNLTKDQKFALELFRYSDSATDNYAGNVIVNSISIEGSGLRDG